VDEDLVQITFENNVLLDSRVVAAVPWALKNGGTNPLVSFKLYALPRVYDEF
jgi:hypothetical protein